MECNLTHDEDNLGAAGVDTVSSALKLTTASVGSATMSEDANEACQMWRHLECLVTALSNRCVSMTDVYVVSLTCSHVGDVSLYFEVNEVFRPSRPTEASVESTLVTEVASVVETTVAATLGEFTVVDNNDGHDVRPQR